jgi:DNA-binding transcriptional MerR regulator
VTDEEQQFNLNELTEVAGVSARTVRYYIGEGLLPPPVVAGPRSYYTGDHLNRLRVIGHLKDAYLPLKEVRRRLNQLDDRQVAVLAHGQAPAQPALNETFDALIRPSEPIDSAANYIARALGQPPLASASALQPSSPAPLQMGHLSFHAYEPVEKSMVESEEGDSWRRIQLGDDAELLIREEAYQRNRDRIDWLMDWAKKVFR